jgi:phosphoribosylglycinamide formyltransferase 1
MARLKVGVLISGRGSNLQALIEACAAPGFPAEIALVISNVAFAPGLHHAADAGIASRVIPHQDFADRAAFDGAMSAALEATGIGLVCLAGFMRILGRAFVARWRDRLINIHPSLLPAFPGLDTHRRALEAGVRFSGCTVHFVRPDVDNGPIVAQAAVPVLPDDSEEVLAARVLTAEHRLYPLALKLIAEGRAKIIGETVAIERPGAPPETVIYPSD